MTICGIPSPMSTSNNVVSNRNVSTNIVCAKVCACYKSSFFILERISSFYCCSFLDMSNNISIKSDIVRCCNANTNRSKEEHIVISEMNILGSLYIDTPSISMMQSTVSYGTMFSLSTFKSDSCFLSINL
jgi:hypothetical protein